MLLENVEMKIFKKRKEHTGTATVETCPSEPELWCLKFAVQKTPKILICSPMGKNVYLDYNAILRILIARKAVFST